MSADPDRAALDAEVLAWMREDRWEHDDARFDALALRLFAHQFDHCAPYRGFCEGRGATPATVTGWREIPAVPTGAFKELALRSFPTACETHVFRTSGTATSARGSLHLDTLALYEASLLPSFRRFLLPDLARGARAHVIVLAPSREEAPDSSLSHMFDVAMGELGDASSHFALHGGSLDSEALIGELERASDADAPLLVCGTAFAFVHWLDTLDANDTHLVLPPHARVMETGGFKGRARERSREVLYAQIAERLGVPETRIVNQYGMTELGSQFYDTTLQQPEAPRRKRGPPWARVHLVDPETGAAARSGDLGMIRVVDLANTGSVIAIETADLGSAAGDGFEVEGRDPYAEARGCSIAIDELLGERTTVSPREIRAELDRLRAAGDALRRRPASEVQGALEQVLDGWSDPDSGWRQRLEASLPAATGFSPETVALGLQRGLEHWDGEALRALVDRELGDVSVLDGTGAHLATGFDVTALLLAGSIPMPSLLALIAPLVLRSPVLAKTASRDAVTAPLVVASLAEIDAELGACAAAVGFAGEDDAAVEALLGADCVVAMGSDTTIASVARRIPASRRLVAYGHRLSVAALGTAATHGESLERSADALALDVALWDQQGCLSPIAVYVVEADSAAADRVATALAQALARAEARWPRGRVDAEVAAAIVLERDTAELRGAADGSVTVHASGGTAWTVVRERDAAPRDAPLHRFVRVHPVADEAALLGALAPFQRHLAAVAIAGFGTSSDALALALAQRGASRICAPGTLQAPPLDWRHEGRGVLTPLARFADRESW